VLVHQVEHAGNAFVVAVSEEGVGREVGHTALDLVGDHAAGPRDRLAAALEHQRQAHRQLRIVRPEAGCIAGRCIDGGCCSLSLTGPAGGGDPNCERRGRANGPEGLTATEMEMIASGVEHRSVLSAACNVALLDLGYYPA